MGLNCGCPAAAALPDLEIAECSESVGQIQKLIFQRIFSAAGVKNSIATPLIKASWTPLLVAADSTKAVVSPYIQGPETEPGAAKVFGGGNATLGGIEIVVGREPTTFKSNIYNSKQLTIAKMKEMMCDKVGVWLVDENGNIICEADDVAVPTKYFPFPINKLFIGDKKLGGFDNPDANVVEFSFNPHWSDKLVILKPTDFNALSDLVNV